MHLVKGKKKKKENAGTSKPLRQGPRFREPSILPEQRDAPGGEKQKALMDFSISAFAFDDVSIARPGRNVKNERAIL